MQNRMDKHKINRYHALNLHLQLTCAHKCNILFEHYHTHCFPPQDDMVQFGRHAKMCRFVLTVIMKLCQVRKLVMCVLLEFFVYV